MTILGGIHKIIEDDFNDNGKLKGKFSVKKYDMDILIDEYNAPNKIVAGGRYLIPRLLATKTQGYSTVSSVFGIDKFTLFGIDSTVTEPDCLSQLLIGDFGDYYTDLNPVVLTEINTTSFPCLKPSDTIEVTTIPSNTCASMPSPGSDVAYITSDTPVTNGVTFCIKIGTGFVTPGQVWNYGLAALSGKSSDPSDANEYVYAIEQFPIMAKTQTVFFSFNWVLYF